MLRNTMQSLGPGMILWYDLSNGKIDMAQDRDRWRALLSAVMNLRVP
jgi:hypothetical protein